jgi:formylglycine-generating enzyme
MADSSHCSAPFLNSPMHPAFRIPLALLVLSLLLANRAPAADAIPPGLVKEQPSSGRFVKTDQGYMVPYKQTIPGTDVTFEMQPIPGGKFLLGSPANEKGHKPDEAPQIEVEIEPFWMSTYEVTWNASTSSTWTCTASSRSSARPSSNR